MNDDQKAKLKKSFAGKAISQMNKEGRLVFDVDFQYVLFTTSNSAPFKGALFDFREQISQFM